MKKSYLYSGLAVLIVLLIGGYFFLTGSSTTPAFLMIDSGSVQVDTGNGWEQGIDQMELGLNDKVKTSNARASLVLHESVIVTLDSDTEITISDLSKKHPKIMQTKGSTWNKFIGLLGVDDFTVETPNTAAIVRGTFFLVNMDLVSVMEGEVEYFVGDDSLMLTSGEKGWDENGNLIKEDMTPEEIQKMRSMMQLNVKDMQTLRMREFNKNPTLVKMVKAKVTETEMNNYIRQADAGEFDLDEIESKVPVKSKSVKKIRALTEEIIAQNRLVKDLANEV